MFFVIIGQIVGHEVKKNLARLLSSYIPMLRFLGSENFYDYIYQKEKFQNNQFKTLILKMIRLKYNYKGA